MRKFQSFRLRQASGFTLVELMIVVLIIAILTAIAAPSYISYVRKSHRAEAKAALTDLAAREERYMATNGMYSSAATDLGYTSWTPAIGSGWYTIAAPTINPASTSSATAAATPANFTITASAYGTQQKDIECATFTINSAGQTSSANSTGGVTTDCW
jgi:type IV pilus assembly protein PilE